MNASQLTSELVLAEAPATAQIMIKDIDTGTVSNVQNVIEGTYEGQPVIFIETRLEL